MLLWCVVMMVKIIVFMESSVLGLEIRPARDERPPRGPSGIGRAAIEKEMSRSRL